MKDYGLNKGLVQQFDTSDRRTKGSFFGFRKMFWEYLNKLNVGFYDPCCPDAALKIPVFYNPTTGTLQYIVDGEAENAPDYTGIPATPSNNIIAGAGGAIPVNNYLTTINTDAGGDAFTLADGTLINQLKKIQLIVDGGGNGVVTPAHLSGAPTTITFDDAADYVILGWNGTDWVVVENSGTTIA